MSLSLVQKLAAQTVLAVANGKNLADELANNHRPKSQFNRARQRHAARLGVWLPAIFGQPALYAGQIAQQTFGQPIARSAFAGGNVSTQSHQKTRRTQL